MEVVPKLILFYETADGKIPARDWLDAMHDRDETTYDRIIRYIERMESGNTSNFKPEGEGITELVMDFGPGYRMYFGQDGKELVILLIGGDKSTQKQDLATAKSYWGDYNA